MIQLCLQKAKQLVLIVNEKSEKAGLQPNTKKTKLMIRSGNGDIRIKVNNEEIEPVQDFVFLGAKINQGGESSPEIKRMVLGRSAMTSMERSGSAETSMSQPSVD